MPTFQFYKNGTKVAEFTGANVPRLEELVIKHKTDAPTAAAAGDGPAAGASTAAATAGATVQTAAGTMVDLTEVIDRTQLNCLNEVRSHGVANLLTASDSYLESDTDEQLLIEIRFNQAVRLHSLRLLAKDQRMPCSHCRPGKAAAIGAPSQRCSAATAHSCLGCVRWCRGRHAAAFAPKAVRLFVNRVNLGFDEASSAASTQDLELTKADVNGDKNIELRFVKFQSVNSITLFVKSNQGGEETTRINRIVFFGVKVDTTDMKDFKKVALAGRLLCPHDVCLTPR